MTQKFMKLERITTDHPKYTTIQKFNKLTLLQD